MQKDNTLYVNQESAWQLLLQFIPPAGSVGEHQSVKRVTEAVQKLGLQPAEVERIGKAVTEALRKATAGGSQGQHNVAVLIRVLIPGADARDRWRSSPDAAPSEQRGRGAWGFFVIQRQEDDPQISAEESPRVLEFHLYWENAPRHP